MNQEIWFFQKGFYAVHINDSKLKQKLDVLKNFKRINTYYDSSGVRGWDYVIPADMYNKVARLLKIPLKTKNANRVRAGKQSKVADGTEQYDLTKVNMHQTLLDASKTEEASKDTTST